MKTSWKSKRTYKLFCRIPHVLRDTMTAASITQWIQQQHKCRIRTVPWLMAVSRSIDSFDNFMGKTSPDTLVQAKPMSVYINLQTPPKSDESDTLPHKREWKKPDCISSETTELLKYPGQRTTVKHDSTTSDVQGGEDNENSHGRNSEAETVTIYD